MTISSSTSSNWVTSCRFAPVTTRDNGTPRPSTRRCRLVPFFSPVGRIAANRFQCQRCLDHCPVNALPPPGDTLHFIVFGKPGSPQRDKKAGTHPSREMGVDRAGTSKAFLGQRFPLATCSENVYDGLENPARWYRLPTSSDLTFVGSLGVSLEHRNKGFNSLPKGIGYFPRLDSFHRASIAKIQDGAQHNKVNEKSKFYLRISSY